MKKMIVWLLCAILLVSAVAGCAKKEEVKAEEPAAAAVETTQEPEEPKEPEAPALSETIVLPDGWTMDSAIAPEDVAGITGLSYTVFPEAASAAQSGKPAGGFVTGNTNEKVTFFAFTSGGQDQYDFFASFVTDGTLQDMPSSIWDKGFYGEFSDGSAAAVILRGDVCLRVNFFPDGYPSFDKTDLAAQLATLFVNKLYGGN